MNDSDIAYLDVEVKKLEKRRLKFGDVILEKSGGGPKQPVGRVALFVKSDGDFSFSNFTAALRVRDSQKLDFRFLHKFLHWTYVSGVTEGMQSHSTGIRNLDGDAYKAIKISFPSIAEQKRIVAILDEAFEGIDTAVANAEKNLTNAREMFESYLQLIFARETVGWFKKPLAAICNRITVGHVGSMAHRYHASGIPFLRSQNIRPFEITMDNVTFIDDVFHRELRKSQLQPGDLAIVRTGYPGTAAVVPHWLTNANCSDLVIIRPGKDILPHYLEAFFNSSFGKKLVLGQLVGAAQKHFNVTAAKEVVLHYPPAREQVDIVAKIKQLRNETKRLEALYVGKIAALARLKHAILGKAFAGELTGQPEKALPEAAE